MAHNVIVLAFSSDDGETKSGVRQALLIRERLSLDTSYNKSLRFR